MKLIKPFQGIRKSLNEAKKTVGMITSDGSVDRDEEIIQVSAWAARLDHYRANPVVCWGHPLMHSGIVPPEHLLGRSLVTDPTPEGLFQDMEFAVDANPQARLCWELVVGDFLKATSVGAGVYGYVSTWSSEEKLKTLEPSSYAALKEDLAWRVITDAELWETSWFFVGSNRNAIRKAIEAGAVSKGTLKKLAGAGALQWPVAKALEHQAHVEAVQSPEVPDATPEPPVPEADPEEAELEALLEDPEVYALIEELITDLAAEIFDATDDTNQILES